MQRQRGAALLVALGLLVLVGAALLYDRLNARVNAFHAREAATARGLAEAKKSLIAWSVSVPSVAASSTTPGQLPFPDRNRDTNYDGKGDCVTFGLNNSHLLGRLPWAGNASPCPRIGLHIDVRDASGEALWYAVSRNLLTNGGGGPINPDMVGAAETVHPWILLRDASGKVVTEPGSAKPLPIAAVVIAPGSVLNDQDRSATAPSAKHYLDRIRIAGIGYDNADSDGCPDAVAAPCASSSGGEEFIVHAHTRTQLGFNDRLTYITVNELARAVEKRVLGEVAGALRNYRDANGGYPWLADFQAPATGPSFKSTLARSGQLPVHLPDEIFATSFGGSWKFIDSTPTTTTVHSGDAKLVPPLVDVESGAIRVSRRDGRCTWQDWTRADCTGSQVIPNYLRNDLGRTVARTVEYSFSISDQSPKVIPPTPVDVRRRTLSASPITLPKSPLVTWSVRITDEDGNNKGQRDISIDPSTRGEVTLSGIRFDLSIVYDDVNDARDELPEWFAENNWHHFIYAALSKDVVPGGNADGDGDCATPANTCLSLKVAGRTVRSDVRALVISSGVQWSGQNRSTGDCDGDGIADHFLCAYFEGDNSDKSTPAADTYARDPFSATFNDQVRIVDPLPP